MKDKSHILHVINRLDYGGLEKGVLKIIQSLSNDFYHSIVVLTQGNALDISFNGQLIFLDKKPGPLCFYYKKLYAIFKKLQPSVLHTRNFSTIECQFIGFLSRIPFRIHSEHGRDDLDLESMQRKKIYLRKASRLFAHQYVALSKDLENYLATKIKVNKNKLIIIPNGVDTTVFTPKKIKQNSPPIFITIGRLEKIKNVQLIITVFAAVVKEIDCTLWIIGDGSERPRLQRLVEELGVRAKVQFMGFCSQPQTWLTQADIYVQTSLYEGISNTILEAMACGLPVIASKVGGNHELIQHQLNGFLFEPSDANSLITYMKMLLINENLRKDFGMAGRAAILDRYTMQHMMVQYYALYAKGFKKEKVCVV